MISDSAVPDTKARLIVKVVPGSSRSEISGWLGDTLKVKVAAQPEKGRANSEVVALLAEKLGLPQKSISVVSGQTSQRKVIEVHGASTAQIKCALNAD
jgi:uncharacterized protein (TIGR00251 family)